MTITRVGQSYIAEPPFGEDELKNESRYARIKMPERQIL